MRPLTYSEPITADDLALMRNVKEYGDFLMCRPVESSISRLIALGLAERVMLPGCDYRLTARGFAALQRPSSAVK